MKSNSADWWSARRFASYCPNWAGPALPRASSAGTPPVERDRKTTNLQTCTFGLCTPLVCEPNLYATFKLRTRHSSQRGLVAPVLGAASGTASTAPAQVKKAKHHLRPSGVTGTPAGSLLPEPRLQLLSPLPQVLSLLLRLLFRLVVRLVPLGLPTSDRQLEAALRFTSSHWKGALVLSALRTCSSDGAHLESGGVLHQGRDRQRLYLS